MMDELLDALRDFVRAEIRDARPDADLVDALALSDATDVLRVQLEKHLRPILVVPNANPEGR